MNIFCRKYVAFVFSFVICFYCFFLRMLWCIVACYSLHFYLIVFLNIKTRGIPYVPIFDVIKNSLECFSLLWPYSIQWHFEVLIRLWFVWVATPIYNIDNRKKLQKKELVRLSMLLTDVSATRINNRGKNRFSSSC